MRDDEKVDDPSTPKKRKKTTSENSTASKEGPNETLSSPNKDSLGGLKSKEFTLINHSENESDAEKSDKKDFDATEANSLPSDTSHLITSSSMSLDDTKSTASIISFGDTSGDSHKFMHKDLTMDEHSRLSSNIIHSSKSHLDSNMFQKIPVGVCLENSNSLFPFSDPHLSVHNCSKIYCDNNSIERTNVSDGNSNHVSSEEDVDVGI